MQKLITLLLTIVSTSVVNSAMASMPTVPAKKYKIYLNEKYVDFTTFEHQGVEYSEQCQSKDPKNSTPKCEAYEFIQIKPKKMVAKHVQMNNFAAIYCSEIFGKNLIALDKDRNEYNFCRFPDGSMVLSWSAYNQYLKKKK